MTRGRSSNTVKKNAIKEETVTKTPKTEKDVKAKEARSRRRMTELDTTSEQDKRSAAGKRKSNKADPAAAGEFLRICQSETRLFIPAGKEFKDLRSDGLVVAAPLRRTSRVTRKNGK